MLAAEPLQQGRGGPANMSSVGSQFRAVAGDAGCIIRTKSGPQLRERRPLPDMLIEPGLAVKFAVELQAQGQQVLVVGAKPITFARRNGLKHEVLHEPAVCSTAKANTPRHPAAGIAGKPQGTLPRTNQVVVEQHQDQVLDCDKAIDDRPIGQIAHCCQGPRLCPSIAATETMTPLVQQGRLFKGSNHSKSLQKKGGTENGDWLLAALAAEPVGLQPKVLGREGFATTLVWPKSWAAHRRHISQPASLLVWLDVGCTGNHRAANCGKIDLFAVDAADSPITFDDDLHGWHAHFARRRIFRRGRSTSMPSRTLETRDISVATC